MLHAEHKQTIKTVDFHYFCWLLHFWRDCILFPNFYRFVLLFVVHIVEHCEIAQANKRQQQHQKTPVSNFEQSLFIMMKM